ncbi:15094_t:CDS:1, partial [Racocetra fulgida]
SGTDSDANVVIFGFTNLPPTSYWPALYKEFFFRQIFEIL